MKKPAKRGGNVRVAVDVRNTGARAGSEVVQVYVGAVRSRVERAPRELKAFRKVTLEPGQRGLLDFDLPPRAFAHYDVKRAA